jgi:hypothetical protein
MLITPLTTLVTGPATLAFASTSPGLKRVNVGTTTKRIVEEDVASPRRVEVRVEGGAGRMVV